MGRGNPELRNKEQDKRRAEVFKLCYEAEKQGITTDKNLANYIYEKTGEKTSTTIIQSYKIDKAAQEKATGILIAEKQLISYYLNNPNFLFPEYLLKIKNTKSKLQKNTINLLTWVIPLIIMGTGYLGFTNRKLILNSLIKPPQEELRLTLNNDYTTSVFKGINKPSALVSGYLYIDFIEELNQPINGIILNKEKGLISISNVPLIALDNYLVNQYGEGELIIKY